MTPFGSAASALRVAAVLLPLLLGWSSPARASSKSDQELIRSLDNEVKALQEKLRAYEEQGNDCSAIAPPDPIYPELVQAFSGSPVRVSRRGSRTLVEIPASLVLATDDVRLREEGAFSLDLLATALNSHKGERVVVTGHTRADPPPVALRKKYPTNLEYSVARATTITLALVTRYGVTGARVTVAGRGDADPIASNDTPEEAAQNERIVIEIIPGSRK